MCIAWFYVVPKFFGNLNKAFGYSEKPRMYETKSRTYSKQNTVDKLSKESCNHLVFLRNTLFIYLFAHN